MTVNAVDDRLAVVEARVRALLEGDLHDECFGRGAQVSVSTPFGRFERSSTRSVKVVCGVMRYSAKTSTNGSKPFGMSISLRR